MSGFSNTYFANFFLNKGLKDPSGFRDPLASAGQPFWKMNASSFPRGPTQECLV